MKHYNRFELRRIRKNLRLKETYAEKLLWNELRRKRLGVKFYRQFGIKNFIVDFYCPMYRLAIEVDGDSHLGRFEEDYERQMKIESMFIKVVRFSNENVVNQLDEVLRMIELNLNSPFHPPL